MNNNVFANLSFYVINTFNSLFLERNCINQYIQYIKYIIYTTYIIRDCIFYAVGIYSSAQLRGDARGWSNSTNFSKILPYLYQFFK